MLIMVGLKVQRDSQLEALGIGTSTYCPMSPPKPTEPVRSMLLSTRVAQRAERLDSVPIDDLDLAASATSRW